MESKDGVMTECLLLAVQRYNPNGSGLEDPFQRFEDFGAHLWSSSVSKVEILLPSNEFCHGIVCPWDGVDGPGLLVMRPLNRVSQFTEESYM